MKTPARYLSALSLAIPLAGMSGTAAFAADRFAAPDGATAGVCPQEAPCTLSRAIGFASPGDRVVVLEGEHVLRGTFGSPDSRLEITSLPGARRPVVTTTAAGGDTALKLGHGSRIAGLELRAAGNAGFALDVRGESVVERMHVRLVAPFARAVVAREHALIRDTTVFGAERSQTGIWAQAPAEGPQALVRLRNVTAVLDGEQSEALRAQAAAEVDVRASILRGGVAAISATPALGGPISRPVRLRSSNVGDNVFDHGGRIVIDRPEEHQQAEPSFFDRAGGDLRQRQASVTIDAGSADGHTGEQDVDGWARAAGTMVDIGAYEHADVPQARVFGIREIGQERIVVDAGINRGGHVQGTWRVLLEGPGGQRTTPAAHVLIATERLATFEGLRPYSPYTVRVVLEGPFGTVTDTREVRTLAAPAGSAPEPAPVPAEPAPAPVALAPDASAPPAPSAPQGSVAPGAAELPSTARRDRTAPVVRLSRHARGLRISLSEAARVRVSVTPAGRWARVRTLRLRRGVTLVAIPRAGGRRCVVRVQATDAAQNRSATRTLRTRCR